MVKAPLYHASPRPYLLAAGTRCEVLEEIWFDVVGGLVPDDPPHIRRVEDHSFRNGPRGTRGALAIVEGPGGRA